MKRINYIPLIAALVLVALGSGCSKTPPPPNPGYRFSSYLQFFEFGIPVRTVKDPDKLFSGDLINAMPGAPGTVGFWRARTNYQAYYDVLSGIAPAEWEFVALDGVCQGLSFQTFVSAGQDLQVACMVPETPSFFAQPDYIDADYPPASVAINGTGINSASGMPMVEYWDQYGYFVASSQATEVAADGTWLSGPTPDIASVHSGRYVLRIKQATGELIGQATMDVYKYEPPPPPDPCGYGSTDPYGYRSTDPQMQRPACDVQTY